MSKLLIYQEKSIIRSFWKPKRKCTSGKEYIESFSRKEKIWKEKRKKKLKNKRKKEIKKERKKRRKKKKKIFSKVYKRGVQQRLSNEKESKWYNGRQPWLVKTFGWWSLFKK